MEDLLRCSALFLAQAIAIQVAFFYKMIEKTNASSVLKYRLVIGLSIDEGVGCLRQQDGGHGSRNPLRSV